MPPSGLQRAFSWYSGGRGDGTSPSSRTQAAMRRIADDAPGPGQEIAIEVFRLAQRLTTQGNAITVRWAPAHGGVEGDEQADQRAKEGVAIPPPKTTVHGYSLAYLRHKATDQATQRWREDIERGNSGRRVFRLPTRTSRPVIRPQLRRAPKRVAARFFQFLSGHAMIAPFLKGRWGLTSTDVCWWCNRRRQQRASL